MAKIADLGGEFNRTKNEHENFSLIKESQLIKESLHNFKEK